MKIRALYYYEPNALGYYNIWAGGPDLLSRLSRMLLHWDRLDLCIAATLGSRWLSQIAQAYHNTLRQKKTQASKRGKLEDSNSNSLQMNASNERLILLI
jgi:hypothetical protein